MNQSSQHPPWHNPFLPRPPHSTPASAAVPASLLIFTSTRFFLNPGFSSGCPFLLWIRFSQIFALLVHPHLSGLTSHPYGAISWPLSTDVTPQLLSVTGPVPSLPLAPRVIEVQSSLHNSFTIWLQTWNRRFPLQQELSLSCSMINYQRLAEQAPQRLYVE